MEVLHLPSNIKVHLAACEVQNQFLAVKELGVSYGLYTAFPFVERKIFGKWKSPIMPMRWMKHPEVDIPKYCCDNLKHCIQDSGLFTLMFGSQAGVKDEQMINKWYDGLVEFTLQHGSPVTCVECDCQKVLGVDKAWEFRQRMKTDLPHNRIINVFHLEDGRNGLDRLIEFSDYIAISVPELRIAGKKDFVYPLAMYIKRKKPKIDIHLLGCTELEILRKCAPFCTSCDSTTYIGGKRYGFLNGHHISCIDTDRIRNFVGADKWNAINEYNNEQNTNFLCLSIESLKEKYQSICGKQDYYYETDTDKSDNA